MKQLDRELKEFKTDSPSEVKKFWNWLWHSDSVWSWLVALVFAFIIVKFIFFPFLSLAFHTQLPLVVVESGSMSHPQAGFLGNTFSASSSFNSWWQESSPWYESQGISGEQAADWPLRTGMEKGDIILVSGWGKPQVGDIIIFNANQAHPIIHRVMALTQNGTVYSTKGDNNQGQLDIEKSIPENALVGKAIFKIPKLGWLKLAFVEIINLFR